MAYGIPSFFPRLPGVDNHAAWTQAYRNNPLRDNYPDGAPLAARFAECDRADHQHSELVQTHEDHTLELLRENVTDYLINGHEFRPLDRPPAEPPPGEDDHSDYESAQSGSVHADAEAVDDLTPPALRARNTRREVARRVQLSDRFGKLMNYRRDLVTMAERRAAETPGNDAMLDDDGHAGPYRVHHNIAVRGIRRAVGVIEHELRRHESLLSTMAADVTHDAARANRGYADHERVLLRTHDELQAVLGEAARSPSGKGSIYAYTGGGETRDGAAGRPEPSAPPLPVDPARAGTIRATNPPTASESARRANGAFAATLPGAVKYPWLMPTLLIAGGVTLLALTIAAIALSVEAAKKKQAGKAKAIRGAAQPPGPAPVPQAVAGQNPLQATGQPAAVPAYAAGMPYGGLPPFGGYGAAGPAAYGTPGPGGYGLGASRYAMVQPAYGTVPPIYG